MSHFTVLVIGDDPEKQLAPYHEFECTGDNNEYVQNVIETGDAREEYESATRDYLVAPDGTEYNAYDSRFYVEKKGDGILPERVRVIPEGYVLKEDVPVKDKESFSTWAMDYYGREVVKSGELPDTDGEHKYGWIEVNEAGEVTEIVRRTNPNAKWDWYLLGGRWTGFFKMKEHQQGQVGRPGIMTEQAEEGRADASLKRYIDIEGMRDEAAAKARAQYRRFHELVGDAPRPAEWDAFRAKVESKDLTIDEARKLYHEQPALVALAKDPERRFFFLDDISKFYETEDQFAQRARDKALMTFAIVKDGKWYERGEMGWWGCVSDEKDENVWEAEFASLIDSVPDDTLLSVFDCHI